MLEKNRRSAAQHSLATDRDLDALILRMHRLVLHRGYDRGEICNSLLKRLMPIRRPVEKPAIAIAEQRRRIEQAGLDRNAVIYLTETVEDELDLARLRLT